MPIAYCDQKLWRIVRLWEPPSDAAPAGSQTTTLGHWAGTVMKEGSRSLVILVNVHTCLAVVFPLCPASDFIRSFKAAVRAALVDMNVDAAPITRETQLLEALEFKRMSRSEFSDVLKYVKYFCGIELMYHSDLLRVQRNLNELPHATIETGVPASAVRSLFARGAEPQLH